MTPIRSADEARREVGLAHDELVAKYGPPSTTSSNQRRAWFDRHRAEMLQIVARVRGEAEASTDAPAPPPTHFRG